jgi:hypothetical protein
LFYASWDLDTVHRGDFTFLFFEFVAAAFTELHVGHWCVAFWALNSGRWIQRAPAMPTEFEIPRVFAPTIYTNNYCFAGFLRSIQHGKHLWSKQKS